MGMWKKQIMAVESLFKALQRQRKKDPTETVSAMAAQALGDMNPGNITQWGLPDEPIPSPELSKACCSSCRDRPGTADCDQNPLRMHDHG